jgi:hypothetical protein
MQIRQQRNCGAMFTIANSICCISGAARSAASGAFRRPRRTSVALRRPPTLPTRTKGKRTYRLPRGCRRWSALVRVVLPVQVCNLIEGSTASSPVSEERPGNARFNVDVTCEAVFHEFCYSLHYIARWIVLFHHRTHTMVWIVHSIASCGDMASPRRSFCRRRESTGHPGR